ncbi:hypothetical protein C3744_18660 [Priestia megaterium]|uniref:Uncharacterized protein n=1 Tax=Priestia megaterium TaxID=1404 RepID=A0A3D8WZB0_PRIMG|nr:hypothetical protein C3744_18660 [Priestia megaterium]
MDVSAGEANKLVRNKAQYFITPKKLFQLIITGRAFCFYQNLHAVFHTTFNQICDEFMVKPFKLDKNRFKCDKYHTF